MVWTNKIIKKMKQWNNELLKKEVFLFYKVEIYDLAVLKGFILRMLNGRRKPCLLFLPLI